MATRWPRWASVLIGLLLWAAVSFPSAIWLFAHSSAEVGIAGHDATVHPTLDGDLRVETGPYLPDLRRPGDERIGVRIVVGKTTAQSTAELVARYGGIAAAPKTVETQVRRAVRELAMDSLARGAVVGVVPIAVWLLLGRRRRRELLRLSPAFVAAVGVSALAVGVLAVRPWREPPPPVAVDRWRPIAESVPQLAVPPKLAVWQVQDGPITVGTQRLISSAFDTYDRSVEFFDAVLEEVPGIGAQLREPEEGEQVAILVSDRHDNVGMDQVARAIADAGGASAILDAGDDTGTGESWEAFSLDSLDDAFDGYDDRVVVAGNHDHGDFVGDYLKRRGWTHLIGDAETVLDGVRMLGADDPRSSGLGTWRDETGLSFAEVRERVADTACELDEGDERVAVVLVHDANLGRDALARGCTDLVLGGHLHRQEGPTRVVGANGSAGYSYTNGTTGGATYAVSVGQRPRVDAQVTLITFADGRPAGVQPVSVRPSGAIEVADYVPLDLS